MNRLHLPDCGHAGTNDNLPDLLDAFVLSKCLNVEFKRTLLDISARLLTVTKVHGAHDSADVQFVRFDLGRIQSYMNLTLQTTGSLGRRDTVKTLQKRGNLVIGDIAKLIQRVRTRYGHHYDRLQGRIKREDNRGFRIFRQKSLDHFDGTPDICLGLFHVAAPVKLNRHKAYTLLRFRLD